MSRSRVWTHRRGPMWPWWQLGPVLLFWAGFTILGLYALVTSPEERGSAFAMAAMGVGGWAGLLWLQPWSSEGRWRREREPDETVPSQQ